MLSKKWLGSDTLRAMSEKYNALIDLLRSTDEGYAKKSIKIVAGLGLKGGGNLEETRTLDVKVADSGILADSNGLRLNLVQVLNSDSTTQGVSARVAKTLNERIDAIARGGEARLLRIAETYDDTSYEVNLPSGQVLISVGKPLFRPKLFIDGTLIPSSWYTVDLTTGVFALSEPYSDSEKLPDFVAKCNILDGYPDALKFAYPTLDMLVASSDMASRIKVGDSVRILGENSAFDGGDCVVKCELTKGLNGVNIGTDLDPRWLNEVPNSKPKTLRTDIDRNTNDINYSQTPIGTVVPFVSDTIPLGWLLCDGREVKETDYPDLYKLLGYGRNMGDLDSLSKHEVPVMTSNSSGGFVASSSSEYSSSYQAYKVFDGSLAKEDCWATANNVKNGWVQLKYPRAKNFSGFSITARAHDLGEAINYIKIELSNDGINWVTQFEENVPVFSQGETRTYKFTNDLKTYLYARCSIAVDSSEIYATIAELKYFTNDIVANTPPQILAQDPTKKYLPFMQGVFAKGNVVGRELGSFENDAIRNIEGRNEGYSILGRPNESGNSGAISVSRGSINKYGDLSDVSIWGSVLNFNASNVVPTADENRPKNISFNYIIKATTVHNPNTVVPVVDEVNRKIEVNRVGVAENKATGVKNTEDIAKGNESVVLWEGNSTGGQVTLIEDYTNFKWIVVEGNYNANELSGNVVVETKTIRKTVTGGVSKNEYAITISGRYMSVIFNPNNSQIGISRLTAGMVLSKVIGVGRV